MAWTSRGGFGTVVGTTAGTTLTLTTAGINLAVGDVCFAVIGFNNTSATDGDFDELTNIQDSGGNTWTKIAERTNGQTGAGLGTTIAMWYSKLSVGLNIGSTITATFANSVTARGMTTHAFTIGAGKVPSIAATNFAVQDAQDPGALTVNPGVSREYVFIRGSALEGDINTFTPTASYTSLEVAEATPIGAPNYTYNITTVAEFRILTGTTSTSNPSTGLNYDLSSVMAAVWEETEATTLTATKGTFTMTGNDASFIKSVPSTIVNLSDYGGVPGAATAVILSAFSQAVAALKSAGGGTLFIQPGAYGLGGAASNVDVISISELDNAYFSAYGATFNFVTTSPSIPTLFSFFNCNDITFSGATFQDSGFSTNVQWQGMNCIKHEADVDVSGFTMRDVVVNGAVTPFTSTNSYGKLSGVDIECTANSVYYGIQYSGNGGRFSLNCSNVRRGFIGYDCQDVHFTANLEMTVGQPGSNGFVLFGANGGVTSNNNLAFVTINGSIPHTGIVHFLHQDATTGGAFTNCTATVHVGEVTNEEASSIFRFSHENPAGTVLSATARCWDNIRLFAYLDGAAYDGTWITSASTSNGTTGSNSVHVERTLADRINMAALPTYFTPFDENILTASTRVHEVTTTETSLLVGRAMPTTTGTFTMTGVNNAMIYGKGVAGSAGTFAVTTVAANLVYARKLAGETAAITVTGSSASAVKFSFIMPAVAATFAQTASDAAFKLGKGFDATPTSFGMTGTSANLTYGRLFTVDTATFTTTGGDASFNHGWTMSAEASTIGVTGYTVSFPRENTPVPEGRSRAATMALFAKHHRQMQIELHNQITDIIGEDPPAPKPAVKPRPTKKVIDLDDDEFDLDDFELDPLPALPEVQQGGLQALASLLPQMQTPEPPPVDPNEFSYRAAKLRRMAK